jgi:hypothetical protein
MIRGGIRAINLFYNITGAGNQTVTSNAVVFSDGPVNVDQLNNFYN